MKSKIKILLVMAAVIATAVCFTPKTNAQNIFGIGTNAWAYLSQLQPFTTNRAAMVQVGVGYNTGTPKSSTGQGEISKKIILEADVTIPLSSHTGIGIGGAHIDQDWETANVNFSISITNDPLSVSILQYVNFLGPITETVCDGPVHNWSTHATGNFFQTQFIKNYHLGSYVDAGLGLFVDNDTTRSGMDIGGGAHIAFHGSGATGYQLSLTTVTAHETHKVLRRIGAITY